MKKLFIVPLLVFLLISGSSFLPAPYLIEKLSVNMVSRQLQAGKSVTLKARIYYQRNGNMVTYFTDPRHYIVVSNKVGELKIYDPAKNTVQQYQNFLFSSQSSQFYYFFSGKSADMGLGEAGYVQEKTYAEKNLFVTLWKLKKADKKAQIQKVKLVFQGQRPIYMHYLDGSNKIIRKVFYYNYSQVENNSLPMATTEIVYADGDSTITKTTFSELKYNHQATGEYFNFKIPSNAKPE